MNPPKDREDSKPWPLWLKTICGIVLAVGGFGVGWCTWVTSNVYAAQSAEQRLCDLERERIPALEKRGETRDAKLTEILLALEQIKAKLGVQDK